MKNFVLKYWWVLPLLLALMMVLLMLLFTTIPSILETIVGCMLLLVIVFLPVSWVILLLNKQWLKFLLSIIMSVLIVCILWFPFIMMAMTGPDGFGKQHPIPDGLEYNVPHAWDSNTKVVVDKYMSDTYLQIYEGVGGAYSYDFYYPPLPAGEIFLKCYEVTKNIPLSEDTLPESTKEFFETTESFTQLVDKKKFIIYEGDWGDYYAARIEVWYKNAFTKKERKLMDKIYRVEGWMR